MDALNKVTIQVKGIKYHITTKEEASYVVGLAHKIDEAVSELMQDTKAVSLNEALVLVAMSYIDAFEKSDKTADSLRAQIAEYLEDAAKARLEASEARRELSRLEKRLSEKS